MNWALIVSSMSFDIGASASANSRPAKQELRFANSAHDMLAGHGVKSCRNNGLLTTRAVGAA